MWNGRSVAVLVSACIVGVMCGGASVWATIDNLKAFKQAYPGKDAKAYSCKVCHLGALGKATDQNAYGRSLKQLPSPANPKKLTIDDFKAAESVDADGDGVTNGAELQAGTDPANPDSKPAGGQQ